MFGSAALACAGLVALSGARHFWVAAPVLFVTGFFGLILVASCNTSLQLEAPDALRGRVMSLYTLVWGGVFPFGAFLVGAMSEGDVHSFPRLHGIRKSRRMCQAVSGVSWL